MSKPASLPTGVAAGRVDQGVPKPGSEHAEKSVLTDGVTGDAARDVTQKQRVE